MNIYRVTNVDTGESWTGTTFEVTRKVLISKDALYWHDVHKRPYAGLMFEKIGNDGHTPHHFRKHPAPEVICTQTNKGLDEDAIEADKLGISYGLYKAIKDMRIRG